MPANYPTRNPDKDLYERTEKTDGTIIFTPKKKEVTGERSRVKQGEDYFYVNCQGSVSLHIDSKDGIDHNIFDYGNYYPIRRQAQAVADLRRHVYKFPPTTPGRMITVVEINNISDCRLDSNGVVSYLSMAMPTTSSLSEKRERQRLIKKCLELNGYVSI